MDEEKKENGNLYFKNEQNKFKPLVINGRTYRIISKINNKFNPNSNIEQQSGFNIKNAKEIEENDDVDSYSGDSDFLKEEEEAKNEIKEDDIKGNEINGE